MAEAGIIARIGEIGKGENALGGKETAATTTRGIPEAKKRVVFLHTLCTLRAGFQAGGGRGGGETASETWSTAKMDAMA
jgi:hypothetical protein